MFSSIKSGENSWLVSLTRSAAFGSDAAVDCSSYADISGWVFRYYILSLQSVLFSVEKLIRSAEISNYVFWPIILC